MMGRGDERAVETAPKGYATKSTGVDWWTDEMALLSSQFVG